MASHRVHIKSLQLFVDRIHEAEERGQIEVDYSDGTEIAEVVRLRAGELARFLMILTPEEYPSDLLQPPVTHTSPGTPKRVAVMEKRMESGQKLYRRGDAVRS